MGRKSGYKILWQMRGEPKLQEWEYFSVTTRPHQRLTELSGSDGGLFGHFYYSCDGEITGEMLDRQLRRLTVVDPEDLYTTARRLGAKGGIGEADLTMTPQKAASLQKFFDGTVKLVKIAGKSKERRPEKEYAPKNVYVVM